MTESHYDNWSTYNSLMLSRPVDWSGGTAVRFRWKQSILHIQTIGNAREHEQLSGHETQRLSQEEGLESAADGVSKSSSSSNNSSRSGKGRLLLLEAVESMWKQLEQHQRHAHLVWELWPIFRCVREFVRESDSGCDWRCRSPRQVVFLILDTTIIQSGTASCDP